MTTSALSDLQTDSSQNDISGLHKPVVLIGLMGAGKSTIGKRLAKLVGREFVDSDDEIETAAACSISDIFAIHGETIFRDLEERVIKRLLEQPGLIIATGGGAWMQPRVREMIKSKGLSIWLKADLEVLVDRVERRNHRPLLETGNKREILGSLMEQRYPVYAEADLTVESGDGPHENVADDVIRSIKEYIKAA